MSQVLGERTPVARKRYQCWFCGTSIQIGERHGRRVGVDGGDFWTMRFHPECQAEANRLGWDEGDYECHYPGDDFERPKK